jgi:hypothetical protein
VAIVAGPGGDGPFIDRAKKEVAVAAKESLKIGNRKVFDDIVLFVQ